MRKPLDRDIFLLAVADILLVGNPAAANSRSERPILLVENRVFLCEAMTVVLMLEGYSAERALNGHLALQAITQRQYALILLSADIPTMACYEFLAADAGEPDPHSPVILYGVQTHYMAGILPSFVIGKLSKPFAMTELLPLVKKHIQPA